MFLDKLGRIIKVGDYVVSGCHWSHTLLVAKVYRITERSVCFRYIGNKKLDGSKWWGHGIHSMTSPKQVLDPENISNWRGYTMNSEQRLLIIKRETKPNGKHRKRLDRG